MAQTKTILIVESDSATRQALAKGLTDGALTTLEAQDASEAVALALKHLPDFVFIDTTNLQHDGMDGFALVRKLRTSDWGRNVPLLVLGTELEDEARLREENEDAPFAFMDIGEAAEAGSIEKRLRECLTELVPGPW